MTVSVVIPAHNEAEYIKTCLESIFAQTVAPKEVILVDNNSTDNTAAIASQFDVKIIHEKKKGVTAARNAGYSAATGDIIARTDADTIVPLDWIEKIVTRFKKGGIIGLSGPVTYSLKRKIFSPDIFFSPIPSKVIMRQETLFGPNMAISRDAWEKVKDDVCLDDKKVHEDLDLSIHLSRLGKIVYDRDIIVTTSPRRVQYNLPSLLFEYPARWFKTLISHAF